MVLIGYEDTIEIDFLNTKLAVPEDLSFSEDEYLDYFEDFELRMVPKSMNPEISDKRGNVKLGGKSYLRDHIILHEGSETGNIYIYVRKLDDSLLCCVSIAIWSDKSAEDYEKLFE